MNWNSSSDASPLVPLPFGPQYPLNGWPPKATASWRGDLVVPYRHPPLVFAAPSTCQSSSTDVCHSVSEVLSNDPATLMPHLASPETPRSNSYLSPWLLDLDAPPPGVITSLQICPWAPSALTSVT